MKNKKISIVLPTYNERENIKKIITSIIRTCEKFFNHFEIIVVDDNSPDGTSEEVKKFKDKRIRLFVRKKEKGLASAIKFGIKRARYDYVCVMDADFQHPPEYIPKLYKKIREEKLDLVVASRFLKESKIVGFGIRRIFSKTIISIVSSFFPNLRDVTDPLSGFFILNKKKIKLDGLRCIGFKFLFELLVKQKLNFREISFKFDRRRFGNSKMNFSEVLNFLKLFVTLLFETKEYVRILKFFLIGLSGVIVNEFLLYLLTEFLKFYYLISAIISIEISILWNFFLGEFLVFWDLKKPGIKNLLIRMIKSNVVRAFSMFLELLILFIFVEVFSVHYLISNLIGIVFASLLNYILSLKKVYN